MEESPNVYGGLISDILSLKEPLQSDAIKEIPPTKLYPVFNPGKTIAKVKYRGNVEKFPPGETLVPVAFAIWLIGKYAPNEYDRPSNKPVVLLDGKVLPEDSEEKPKELSEKEQLAQEKRLEEMTALKYLLDDNNVPYPDDASISKLRDLRAKLNKKLNADKKKK